MQSINLISPTRIPPQFAQDNMPGGTEIHGQEAIQESEQAVGVIGLPAEYIWLEQAYFSD